jgi:hypothetical protein
VAFEELLVQERLLKAGDLVLFQGQWGEPYANQLFRVTAAENTQRVRQVALSAPQVQTVIDIDDIGLNPEHALWAYEVRIGISKSLVKLYSRWPTNDFTRQIQDPNFSVNPTDPDLRLIGYTDHISSPFHDPRFRWFWIKDQLPSFVALADSGPAAAGMYQKVLLRFIINVLGLQEETDQSVIDRVQTGELFVSTAQHYELIGRRAA